MPVESELTVVLLPAANARRDDRVLHSSGRSDKLLAVR